MSEGKSEREVVVYSRGVSTATDAYVHSMTYTKFNESVCEHRGDWPRRNCSRRRLPSESRRLA